MPAPAGPGHRLLERLTGGGGVRLLVGEMRRLHLGARDVEAGAEAAQVGVDLLAVGADRGFELLGGERQPAAAGDGAEHDRVDDRAALLRQPRHVDQHERSRAWSLITLVSLS